MTLYCLILLSFLFNINRTHFSASPHHPFQPRSLLPILIKLKKYGTLKTKEKSIQNRFSPKIDWPNTIIKLIVRGSWFYLNNLIKLNSLIRFLVTLTRQASVIAKVHFFRPVSSKHAFLATTQNWIFAWLHCSVQDKKKD